VDQLAKQAAQMALRLAALPADGLRNDLKALQDLEELARGVLHEVAAIRMSHHDATVGETTGIWRAVQPLHRQ